MADRWAQAGSASCAARARQYRRDSRDTPDPGVAPSRLDASGLALGGPRAVPAERDRCSGRRQVIQDQELHECERLGAVKVRPDRELAEPFRAQMRREVELLP